MAIRRKRETVEMRELGQKIAAMKSIDRNYDSGNGVTLAAAEAVLLESADALDASNQAAAVWDEKDNIFKDKNKLVRAFTKKILPAAGLKYGTDSNEYEMLGGVRDSERKKRMPKPKENK